jgi:nucleotidyltransferase/DNA polymerase involved in DNA repair
MRARRTVFRDFSPEQIASLIVRTHWAVFSRGSPPRWGLSRRDRNLQGIPLARDIARRIREKIKAETGLNASAGISYNKFLAKLASDTANPNGQYVISPEMGAAFVEKLPVGKFHGIGPTTTAKMNGLGIFTGLDMRNQSLEFMNRG